jgi:hypothetical protein
MSNYKFMGFLGCGAAWCTGSGASDTLASNHHTTRRHNPENHDFSLHCHGNLKTRFMNLYREATMQLITRSPEDGASTDLELSVSNNNSIQRNNP